MILPDQIIIEGVVYSKIRSRVYMPDYGIYASDKSYLRVGPSSIIDAEHKQHKELLSMKFPVPRLLSSGVYNNQPYYIEESMGDKYLAHFFSEDIKTDGKISKNHFEALLLVVSQYAEAQISNTVNEGSFEEFSHGFYLNDIIKELPHRENLILKAFEKVKNRVRVLPNVFTHGDFNPHNIFEKGIIDLEHFHTGVYGYDVVNTVYHTYLFPEGKEFEATRRYFFTKEQIAEFFEKIDKICLNHNVQPLSTFVDEFILCRMVFAAVHMDRYPKLQKWRYELLEKMLRVYLEGGRINITDYV